MPNNNKQAVEVKNSSLSARTINILVALATIIISTLLIIFAPEVMLAIGKFLGVLAMVAMFVGTALYALLYESHSEE